MSKRNKVIFGISVIFFILVLCFVNISLSLGYKITISNNTNKTIENLELRYSVGDTIETISQIEPKKSWKDTINTNTIKGENSIILTYEDTKGNSHEETIVGYLEKGNNGHVKVTITEIDDAGKLELEIK